MTTQPSPRGLLNPTFFYYANPPRGLFTLRKLTPSSLHDITTSSSFGGIDFDEALRGIESGQFDMADFLQDEVANVFDGRTNPKTAPASAIKPSKGTSTTKMLKQAISDSDEAIEDNMSEDGGLREEDDLGLFGASAGDDDDLMLDVLASDDDEDEEEVIIALRQYVNRMLHPPPPLCSRMMRMRMRRKKKRRS